MNKILLTVGCSFSALYYHKDPAESYTLRLAKELNMKLINLNCPGVSPRTIFRLLHQYLENPIHGVPDFVFVQLPFAFRQEYWVDKMEGHHRRLGYRMNKNEFLSDRLEWAVFDPKKNKTHFNDGKATQESWDRLKETIIAVTRVEVFSPEKIEDTLDPDSKPDQFYLSVNDIHPKLTVAHNIHFAERSHRIIELHTYARLIEQLLESKSLKYCYVETDYDPSIPDSTCFIDELLTGNPGGPENQDEIEQAYEFAKTLCSKKHFIPYVGINPNSTTFKNDNYKCNHPGSESHRAFTDTILPEIKKRL